MDDADLNTRAVTTTAKLLLRQNPKAFFRTVGDELKYFMLVTEWCKRQQEGGVYFYYNMPFSVDLPAPEERFRGRLN